MQLNEQIQQHVVALPVDLQADVLDFVLALEQKQAQHAKEERESKKRHFLDLINTIEPVTAPFSSEKMVEMVRQGKENLIIEARENNAE